MGKDNYAYRHQVEGKIWKTIISENQDELVFDIRNEQKQSVRYFKLDLNSLELTSLEAAETTWWSTIERYDGMLYVSEYQDKSDPNRKRLFSYSGEGRVASTASEEPVHFEKVLQPSIYELGTAYFDKVAQFLGLDLPCSCEYLQVEDKIIISYYLRFGKDFERYLLLLDAGKKALKELLDEKMKGFAPGAFFVLRNRLCFIRNRNEICIYHL